jgi:hypothetical protein
MREAAFLLVTKFSDPQTRRQDGGHPDESALSGSGVRRAPLLYFAAVPGSNGFELIV